MLDTITYLHAKFQLIPTKFSTDVFLNREIWEFFSAVPLKNVGSRCAKTDDRKNKKIAEGRDNRVIVPTAQKTATNSCIRVRNSDLRRARLFI